MGDNISRPTSSCGEQGGYMFLLGRARRQHQLPHLILGGAGGELHVLNREGWETTSAVSPRPVRSRWEGITCSYICKSPRAVQVTGKMLHIQGV